MAAPVDKQQRRVFRLAVYGVRSSGKTCILSALTLPRVKHPLGFSCSWIESVPENPLPTDAKLLADSTHPLHAGWRFLTQQRERLRKGDVPEPTKLGDGVMAFRFDFGTRNRGARHVELIDYAGELITASASEIAGKLRSHMNECDGLLVLAETPYPERDQSPLAEELVKLQNAFSLLLNEKAISPRESWPVAILFNKWDRRGGPAPTVESAEQAVATFLHQNPPPPHASLVDAVVNAVGEENVRFFPASAFGGHLMRDDGKEVPLLINGVMQSYGLEDGFLWVIQRAEELEVEQLVAAEQATSWWAFWQLFGASPAGHSAVHSWKDRFWGISAVKGLASGWKTVGQLADGDWLKRQAQVVTRNFQYKALVQTIVLFVTLLVSMCSVESVFDGVQFRGVQALKQDANASDADLESGEAWCETYFRAPSYRHVVSRLLVLGRSQALASRDAIQEIREERAWKRVEDAGQDIDKCTVAEAYLAKFPSGDHQSAATGIVNRCRAERDERENLAHLAAITMKLDQINGENEAALEAVGALFDDAGRLPFPATITPAVSESQQAVRTAVAERQDRILGQRSKVDWEQFVLQYRELLKDRKVVEAAFLLSQRREGDPRAAELLTAFEATAPGAIRENVQEAVSNYAWDEARRHAAALNDPVVAKLLPAAAMADLRGLDELIAAAEDEHMYSLIVRNKPACRDQIEAYLTRAPLKTMESNVDSYRQYLTKIEAPLDLTLVLTSIRWGSNFYSNMYSYRNDISVKCRGQEVITRAGVKSHADSESRDLGEGVFQARMRENVTLEVFIRTNYGAAWDSQMDGGHGIWQGTPEELRKGVSLDAKGDGFTNHVMFSIHGIPTEPTLPPWRR